MATAKVHVKKGDTVVIISGSSDRTDPKTGQFKAGIKGKTGKVKLVNPKEQTVIVEGLNMVTKAVRPNQRNQQGGFMEQEAPLPSSKVMPICPSCGKPTRVKKKMMPDGGKVRACVKCDGNLDV
jgi:large subunit ribosomal protein L24